MSFLILTVLFLFFELKFFQKKSCGVLCYEFFKLLRFIQLFCCRYSSLMIQKLEGGIFSFKIQWFVLGRH